MLGPTNQGIKVLLERDLFAFWDETAGRVNSTNPLYKDMPDWRNHPRVIKIALFDPREVEKSGMQSLAFNNIALMFLETQEGKKDQVTGRFIEFAKGIGGGPDTGASVLYLRLVE